MLVATELELAICSQGAALFAAGQPTRGGLAERNRPRPRGLSAWEQRRLTGDSFAPEIHSPDNRHAGANSSVTAQQATVMLSSFATCSQYAHLLGCTVRRTAGTRGAFSERRSAPSPRATRSAVLRHVLRPTEHPDLLVTRIGPAIVGRVPAAGCCSMEIIELTKMK